MLSEMLSSLTGIGSSPLVGLIIFVVLFLSVLITIYRMDSAHCKRMAELPLDGMTNRDRLENNAIEMRHE